jgi:hypothetical protein
VLKRENGAKLRTKEWLEQKKQKLSQLEEIKD